MDYKEKIIALLNSQELSKEQKEKLESIFPALKESEDERIRKALIELVHDTTGDSLWVDYNVHKEDAIAWLEKQTEQKLYVNDNAKEMFIKALERVEEQNNKGYKLTDCDKNSWWEDFKVYTTSKQILANSAKTCKDEQKSTWSEEDEKIIRELESLVKQVWAIAERENDKDKIHKMSNLSFFLKTLKPQLKQEWSEEDKAILEKCIGAVKVSCYSQSFKSEAENWLKSLKGRVQAQPQNSWKPSDEQMKCLDNVKGEDNHNGYVLNTLYNDLKRLLKI